MSKKKKAFYIIFFACLDIFLIFGFVSIHNATMLNYLRKEMEILENKNLLNDSFSYQVVTFGGYAKVEKAIKGYLYDYSSLLKEIMIDIQDDQLKKILSYDNYQKDGPDFENSISYLNEKKSVFNKKIDVLIKQSDKKTMQQYIHKKTYQSYYQKLYQELFVNDSFIQEFEDNKTLLESTKSKMNHIFDTSLEVLNFLVSEKENWVIEDGEIKFQTKELYNKYMEYISLLK